MRTRTTWSTTPVARGALEGAVAGAVVYYATLAVAAVVAGLGASYPFRAINAMFGGNRSLPGHGPFFDDSGWIDYLRGTGWILFLSLLCAATFFLIARHVARVLASPYVVVAGAVVWSLLWLGLTLLLFDHPRTPALRRQVMTLAGLHEIGVAAFVAAHAAFGVALGVGSVRPRRERARPSVAAVSSRAGTW